MDEDEAWLYGDESQQATKEPEINEKAALLADDSSTAFGLPEGGDEDVVDEEENLNEENVENGDNDENGDDGEDDDDDDDSEDDGFKITIDHDKIDEAKTTYQTFGIGKPARPALAEKKGKFSVEEFDQIGMINGQMAVDLDLDSLEDKPWRQPGADLSDYFNYGFTEETWSAYTSRQRRMRTGESGVGMPTAQGMPNVGQQNVTPKIVSNNSNFSNQIQTVGVVINKKPTGVPVLNQPPPSISVVHSPAPIAVMTSDKRIYSKKLTDGQLDFSVPPPGLPPTFDGPPPIFDGPPPGLGPPGVPPPSFGMDDHFGTEPDFYGGYEPTQESQWSLPPPAESFSSHTAVPGNNEAPPGDLGYPGRDRDVWGRRRPSRDNTPSTRSFDRRPEHSDRETSSRSSRRRRSRSRSRDRYEGRDRDRDRDQPDREREKERERGDREPERERDRERDREKRERRRASRSPSGGERHKHKKSKKDKKEKVEIKKEREDD